MNYKVLKPARIEDEDRVVGDVVEMSAADAKPLVENGTVERVEEAK